MNTISTGDHYLKADSSLAQDIELIEKNQETLKQFTGHLLQAIEKDYLLIIATPLTEDGNLHILISFACAIAGYNTNLIVVPENQAGQTLGSVQKSATLLDYKGQHKAGEKLCEDISHYADAIVEQVLATTDLQNRRTVTLDMNRFAQYIRNPLINALATLFSSGSNGSVNFLWNL